MLTYADEGDAEVGGDSMHNEVLDEGDREEIQRRYRGRQHTSA
jgi:hypothetical protein